MYEDGGDRRADGKGKDDANSIATRKQAHIVPVEVLGKTGLDGKPAGSNFDRMQRMKLRGIVSQGLLVPVQRFPQLEGMQEVQDDEERRKHEPSPRLVRRWTKEPSTTERREEHTVALRLLEPPKVVLPDRVSVAFRTLAAA